MAKSQLEKQITDLEKQMAARGMDEAITTLIVVRDVAADGQPVQKKPYDPEDFDISPVRNGIEVWWPKGEGPTPQEDWIERYSLPRMQANGS